MICEDVSSLYIGVKPWLEKRSAIRQDLSAWLLKLGKRKAFVSLHYFKKHVQTVINNIKCYMALNPRDVKLFQNTIVPQAFVALKDVIPRS
jgi:hypothetical protein